MPTYDLFLSHASEDKDSLARPLALALRREGYSVWYDEFELLLGDSLSARIDEGLRDSTAAVLILSQAFLHKAWPRRELVGLTALSLHRGTRLLPIWHGVAKDTILEFSPALGDVVAIESSVGLYELVRRIAAAVPVSHAAVPTISHLELMRGADDEPRLLVDDEPEVLQPIRGKLPAASVFLLLLLIAVHRKATTLVSNVDIAEARAEFNRAFPNHRDAPSLDPFRHPEHRSHLRSALSRTAPRISNELLRTPEALSFRKQPDGTLLLEAGFVDLASLYVTLPPPQ